MANKKLTDLTELTTPADNDFLYIVDVSDTTESAQGTSKKIRKDKVDSGASKENIANKQNDLTPDGTGTKYPTVDAVNTIDLQKVIDIGGYAEVDAGNSFVTILSGDENDRMIRLKSADSTRSASLQITNSESLLRADDEITEDYSLIVARPHETFFETNVGTNQQRVALGTPLADAVVVNFPTPSISGTYTLATTDDIDTQVDGTVNNLAKFTGVNSVGNSLLRDDGSRMDAGNLTGTVNSSINDYIFNINNTINDNPKRISLFSVNSDLESTITNNTLGSRGIWSRLSVKNANTKNWGGIASFVAEVVTETGAIGTISEMTGLQIAVGNASDGLTIDNVYGIKSNYLSLNKPTVNTAGLAFSQIENATNSTQLLLGTKTIPTGNYAIHDVTGYNSLFSGKLKYASDYSATYDARTLVDKAYTDAKITQTIANGVTDKSPSEDAVFDATFDAVKTIISDTPTSTNTGGVSEVLMHTYVIPAGKLPTSCMPNLKLMVSKTGTAGNVILKIKVNSVNNFATSVLIGSVQATASNLAFIFNRNFALSNGVIAFSNPTSLATDESFSTSAISSTSLNTLVEQYIFVSLQNSNATDTTSIKSIKLIN